MSKRSDRKTFFEVLDGVNKRTPSEKERREDARRQSQAKADAARIQAEARAARLENEKREREAQAHAQMENDRRNQG